MNESLHLVLWKTTFHQFNICNIRQDKDLFISFLPAAELAVLWSLKLKVTSSHALCACSALWCRSLFASQASSAVTLMHANLLFYFFSPPDITSSHSKHGASKQQIAANVQHIFKREACLFVCIVSDELRSNPPWKIHLHTKLLCSSAAHQILMIRHGPLDLITMLKVSAVRPAM